MKGESFLLKAAVMILILMISKNRRDGATVSSRVLTMSDIVGRQLFYNAAAPAPAGVSSRQMRRKAIATDSKL